LVHQSFFAIPINARNLDTNYETGALLLSLKIIKHTKLKMRFTAVSASKLSGH
jgi:hypothetical protein